MRKRNWLAGLGLVACVIAGGASPRVIGRAAAAATAERPNGAGF